MDNLILYSYHDIEGNLYEVVKHPTSGYCIHYNKDYDSHIFWDLDLSRVRRFAKHLVLASYEIS